MVRRLENDTDIGYCTSDAEATTEDASMVKHGATRNVDDVGDLPDFEFLKEAAKEDQEKKVYKWDLVWRNIILAVVYHILAVYGLYLWLFKVGRAQFYWTFHLAFFGALGITAGAHRLWAHKTYKAKLPLRVILLFYNTVAFQNSVIEWSRDHRVHHKFTETDADPHNAKRGFFFSHIGWLLIRKHNDVKTIGKKVSVQDLRDDPMLDWQDRHYVPLIILCCGIIPTFVPVLCWNENFWTSFMTAGVCRYIISLNYTWCINSVAHLFGHRPYDKSIFPRQNIWASFVTLGEGFHNFHHKFPRDYRASEFPGYWFNPTRSFIELMAKIGWAYDLKMTSQEAIERTKLRHGDGTS